MTALQLAVLSEATQTDTGARRLTVAALWCSTHTPTVLNCFLAVNIGPAAVSYLALL